MPRNDLHVGGKLTEHCLDVFRQTFDIPTTHPFVQMVVKNYVRTVGQQPRTVGTILPLAYSGDDTCHLWRAGIPCVLYGPTGVYAGTDEPDNYVLISEMERCARVLAATALDMCG